MRGNYDKSDLMKDDLAPPEWERYGDTIDRIKVDGGHIYRVMFQGDVSTSFVPDVDLQRYQAHLRDAYKQGYADGREDVMIKHGITADKIVQGDLPKEIVNV